MSSSFDLTSATGLREYLVANGHSPADVQLLTGGNANYVYRVKLNDGRKVIFKHAESYLSSDKSFALDSARITFEAAILQGVAQLQQTTPTNTHAAVVHSYDEPNKLLCIAEGGDRHLKDAYSDPSLHIPAIGTDLATWLASLHSNSRSASIAVPSLNLSIVSGGGNNKIAVKTYRHSYDKLHIALTKFGHDISLAEKVNREFGSLLATDDECLCHGDFWPGNVLVQPKPNSSVPDLTVVDWELSRRGTSATDVGQFAAEAFLLDRFKGGRGLRVSFLNAYVAAREQEGWSVDREWVRRMAVHWAVHVAYWPTIMAMWPGMVPWADESGTRELVKISVETLGCVLSGDWERLRKSKLFDGLSGEWDAMFKQE